MEQIVRTDFGPGGSRTYTCLLWEVYEDHGRPELPESVLAPTAQWSDVRPGREERNDHRTTTKVLVTRVQVTLPLGGHNLRNFKSLRNREWS